MMDLHRGFRGSPGPASELIAFLHEVDQLPGIRAIRRALAAAGSPAPGGRLLDAGCGIGLETRRLAAAHPAAQIVGLDVNPELLAIARADPLANLEYVEGDLTALEEPEPAFDVVRTERVLMYLPDRALDALAGRLRPGGTIALFELDYGATLLAPGAAPDTVVTRAEAALCAALPQPWAGRRLPGRLRELGLEAVTAEPWSFTVSAPVWRGIVAGTLRDLDLGLNRWLAEQDAAAERGEFVAAFTGMLCTGRRARRPLASAAP